MRFFDYTEQKLHGTPDFPVALYRLDEQHPQYVMVLHRHPQIEIVRVKRGTLRLFDDTVEYRLGPEDVVLLGPGALHRAEPEHCEYECLVFDPGMLCRKKGDALDRYLMPLVSVEAELHGIITKKNGRLYATIMALFEAMAAGEDYYVLSVYAGLMELITLLYREGRIWPARSVNDITKGHCRTMSDVTDWIAEHYAERITLATLAEVAHMNEKYFCRVFRCFTGQSPMHYLNGLRVEVACHVMIAERLSVTEAAVAVGFDDMSYFSRVFRKYKGISPGTYRKNSHA